MSLDRVKERYEKHRRQLNQMIAARNEHHAAAPNCPGAPLCIGVVAHVELNLQNEAQLRALLVVAIGEIGTLRSELAASQAAIGGEMLRAEAAEERVREISGVAQALQNDLDAMEAAADILRPGLMLGDLPPET